MFERLEIPDLILVSPKRHEDARGWFVESYRADSWKAAGIDADFVQDNHSLSIEAGVIRGLHFQTPPHAQAKLLRCSRGSLFDVAVDIRKGSPWFGKHVARTLSAEQRHQLYVPVGFAHGFCALEPNTELQYKVSDYYAAECDAGIRFDDSALAIEWPVAVGQIVLSEKDRRLPKLADIPLPFTYEPDRKQDRKEAAR